ncbi:cytidine deaminase-like [Episyrphus balteatus]|uniref:cytidine deaminase-like n=1 Tax=Episyrphus balteatus TaxID=286459 RepID=UPI002484F039|nr:cytidine deaminase-like [Episyrphus balteatus]
MNNKKFIDCTKQFSELDSAVCELILTAISARKFAYVPYSNFPVGAALRTKCGKVFSGCNVENAAFTPGACAERTAICKAISEGYKEFESCAVVAYQKDTLTPPCGVCRQFLIEFAVEDFPVYVARAEDPPSDVLCTSVYNLLPNGFRCYK